ncbi:MAG: hypothetical protein HYT30_00350 [Parcubacteria group bacterium]|nr:hypothetical protein [Parcubacteria group bacterium]
MRAFLFVWSWVDRNIISLTREMRLSYLPPLMVYLAAGIAGLTAIVGTFFVKEYLGLSAEFLAALGFWAGIPWALKMPLGHIVDLMWRRKALLVYLGASLIAANLAIMAALIASPEAMREIMSIEAWFVLAALLAPTGYVMQDVVADAMTVEAVPRYDETGSRYGMDARRAMHTTMQTLGRVAIVGGGIFVSLLNIFMFRGVEHMSVEEKAGIYTDIYLLAFVIPVVSVLGVLFAWWNTQKEKRRLIALGKTSEEAFKMTAHGEEKTLPNWLLLWGSFAFAVVTVGSGVLNFPYNQEFIFAVSLGIVLYLMRNLVRELEPDARRALVGTAVIIFIFRALPGPGAGSSWWMIDVLRFDQHFLAVLSLIGSSLAVLGMFIFRRFMAEKSIAYIVGFLTIASTVLSLPILGMYYGLHEWTAAVSGGIVDAHFIALVDTALESPLGQVAMIPMLAWIANSAPENLKATFFAVMASFSNLALSLSSLGTKYLNQIFTVTREVRDKASNAIVIPEDYSELGTLLIIVSVLSLLLPFAAIVFVRMSRLRSA